MTKSVEAVLRKLDQPPAGHNFSRSNFQSLKRTTTALVNLAIGFPTVSYRWSIDAIQAQISDALTDLATQKLLDHNCPPSQIDHNLEFLLAFQSYNAERKFDGLPVFPEFRGMYLASSEVSVPISPTILLREDGKIKPLFIIPWARNPLNWYQRRLLSTMYEDAIYSLTDLQASDGEVLLFPRNGYGIRKVDRWKRGEYPLLSKAEMVEQTERFERARLSARPMISAILEERAARKVREAELRKRSSSEGMQKPKS